MEARISQGEYKVLIGVYSPNQEVDEEYLADVFRSQDISFQSIKCVSILDGSTPKKLSTFCIIVGIQEMHTIAGSFEKPTGPTRDAVQNLSESESLAGKRQVGLPSTSLITDRDTEDIELPPSKPDYLKPWTLLRLDKRMEAAVDLLGFDKLQQVCDRLNACYNSHIEYKLDKKCQVGNVSVKEATLDERFDRISYLPGQEGLEKANDLDI